MGEVVVSSGEEMESRTEEEIEKTKNNDSLSEVVRWEKFLPRMVLRVLLVEADDSTRQIIAALLRKCSYKVAAVSDGLMAWETLKDRPHSIDLILTEVELPSISGYALLTLVMEHDICKNIPVIMMSSHDSISMVLKCMLKGAADFLIKPVRRNELKNLWQHVWRRKTLIAGHTQNSPDAQQKMEPASENNSASDHSSDCATSSHKRKECSERVSDAQGHSQMKSRSASNPRNLEKENFGQYSALDKRSDGSEKTGEWSTRSGPVSEYNDTCNPTALKLGQHVYAKLANQDESTRPENDRGNANASHGHNDELVESSNGAIDLIGSLNNDPNCIYGHTSTNCGTKFEFSELGLSLRRFFPNNSNQGMEERHTLNHSNASAFSWYNNKILQPLFPTSASNWTEFKEDASKSPQMSSNKLSQNIKGDSEQNAANLNVNQEIMTRLVIGQSEQTELAYQNPKKPIPVPVARVDNICTESGYVFPSVNHQQTGLPPAWSPNRASQQEQLPFPTSTSIHSNPEIHDSDQNNRLSEGTTINTDQTMHRQNSTEFVQELRHGSPAAGQSTSSSMCNGVADHNNSSPYGSLCSRSGGNTTLGAASDKTMVPESLKDGGIFMNDGFRGMDSNRSSQRAAALTKFRMKRKDRCYEKKVRYQSRKTLAEQRPRVKGQFVRLVQNGTPMADTNN